MPSFKIIVLEQAVSELEIACKYYNNQISGLGFELEEEVFSVLELITEKLLLFPIKFAKIHEAVLRRFPFVITYEISERQIIVLAIFHVKKNPQRKFKRKLK